MTVQNCQIFRLLFLTSANLQAKHKIVYNVASIEVDASQASVFAYQTTKGWKQTWAELFKQTKLKFFRGTGFHKTISFLKCFSTYTSRTNSCGKFHFRVICYHHSSRSHHWKKKGILIKTRLYVKSEDTYFNCNLWIRSIIWYFKPEKINTKPVPHHQVVDHTLVGLKLTHSLCWAARTPKWGPKKHDTIFCSSPSVQWIH